MEIELDRLAVYLHHAGLRVDLRAENRDDLTVDPGLPPGEERLVDHRDAGLGGVDLQHQAAVAAEGAGIRLIRQQAQGDRDGREAHWSQSLQRRPGGGTDAF